MKDKNEDRIGLIRNVKDRQESGCIEKSNAELLIKLIENADTYDEANKIAQLGTMWKRTGFYYDVRLEPKIDSVKYLKKNEGLSFITNKDSLTHKLIIGDNYDALLNLKISYAGKIDVIYIDPPYGKDDLGKSAKTNYENAISRDNLLSGLYSRLVLAKDLLTEDGVIFCSIDDKNQAYVKLLFDEVFGEKNFIESIIWVSNPGGRSDKSFIAKTKEYVLVYSKSIISTKPFIFDKEDDDDLLSSYNLIDHISKYKKGASLQKTGNEDKLEDRPKMGYSIYYNPDNFDVVVKDEVFCENDIEYRFLDADKQLLDKGYQRILPKKREMGKEGRWRWGIDKFLEEYNSEIIFDKAQDGKLMVYTKERLFSEVKEFKPKDFIYSSKKTTKHGTQNIKDILQDKDLFKYPKPVSLIKYLINLISKKDCYVLDFFAGSGTTGQAVLELNKEDGGNRQFILCTNNEITDKNPNGIAYDVTSKRLKRVMTGECYDGSKDFKWNKENISYGDNLEVAEIKNISSRDIKKIYDEIDEGLYNIDKFDNMYDKTNWICDNFEQTQKRLETDKEWEKRCYSDKED